MFASSNGPLTFHLCPAGFKVEDGHLIRLTVGVHGNGEEVAHTRHERPQPGLADPHLLSTQPVLGHLTNL